MIELIRRASLNAPDAPAVVSSREEVSYAELTRRAEAMGRGIAELSLNRAACVVASQASLVEVLAATSTVGCEACSYPPLMPDSGIDELATAFGHDVVLTDRELHLTVARTVDVAELPSDAPVQSRQSGDARSPSPLMVLTTGTTARPKAARYDWARLAAPALRRARGAGERWLLAYNLNQFAGIQVMLHAFASQATLVVPESNQPRDALRAMVDHGVTHASATPTFWRFLLALLADGSSPRPDLVQLTLGGEAASGQLLDDLARTFPRAHISHVYASTEFGSGVSVTDGRAGLPLSVLDRAPDSDVQFRIVEGQLEARSSVGMLGYYNDDVAGAEGTTDGWRPTGDLVEIRHDRICFVGRASETINVGGVKVHPLSIEEVVGTVDGVQMAHAYGRANPVSGQIVAVDVVAQPGADREALEDAIYTACEILAPAARPRRVRFVDQLELREQKIVRSSSQAPATG